MSPPSSACHLLSRWYLARLILRPWKWRWHVPAEGRLTFNGIYGVISQKTERFIITAVTTSNPTYKTFVSFIIFCCAVLAARLMCSDMTVKWLWVITRVESIVVILEHFPAFLRKLRKFYNSSIVSIWILYHKITNSSRRWELSGLCFILNPVSVRFSWGMRY
jgi:hypothetical protein